MNDNEKVLLNRVSTIDALVMAMQKDIYDGTWKPGAQITEQEMVERYNVSRHSVREALMFLVNNRYLERKVNKGVYMRVFNEQDISDIYYARHLFEHAAVRELAKKKWLPAEVIEASEKFKNHKQSDPWSVIILNDMKFHKSLVDSLQSERISSLYSNLLVEFELINRQPKKTIKNSMEIYKLHSKIIQAILEGNEELAINSIKEHLDDACNVQLGEWHTV